MTMASLTEHEDMTVVAISLAHAGASRSIGKTTSRASSSLRQCLLRRPCFALRDAAQVLAHPFSFLVLVMLGAIFGLTVVAALVFVDVMDLAC